MPVEVVHEDLFMCSSVTLGLWEDEKKRKERRGEERNERKGKKDAELT